MVLGIIVSETPDLLGYTARQKTQLDTSYMVIRSGILLNGNVLCTHIILPCIVLIYLSFLDTWSSSETGLNVTPNSATAPQIRLVLNCPYTWSVDIWNPCFLYTLPKFTTLCISGLVFAPVIISAVPNYMCLDILIKIWSFSQTWCHLPEWSSCSGLRIHLGFSLSLIGNALLISAPYWILGLWCLYQKYY